MRRRAVLAGLASLAGAPALAAGHPEIIAEIDGPRLIEGIAHDGRRFYLGCVSDGRILSLDRGGRPSDLWPRPLFGVFGLAADPARNRLWAATARLDQPGRTELVEIDTLRRRAVARHAPPAGNPTATFGDVALSATGDVFVSDSKGGAILRLRRGASTLDTVLPAGRLKSPQGTVVQGERLVTADYATGLHRIDLASGALTPVENGAVRGIDGLLGWRGQLIAIQNGASTPRILRFRPGREPDILYEGGVLIEPTLGTIVGDRLLFIGRSQWGEANDKGEVRPGAGPTRVMSLALPA
jgi:hypothetical protein